jgi:hypothetical protein
VGKLGASSPPIMPSTNAQERLRPPDFTVSVGSWGASWCCAMIPSPRGPCGHMVSASRAWFSIRIHRRLLCQNASPSTCRFQDMQGAVERAYIGGVYVVPVVAPEIMARVKLVHPISLVSKASRRKIRSRYAVHMLNLLHQRHARC